ncbi:MAG: hypothetical protein Kow0013_27380 [Pararhodobacter sp.]
MIPARLMVMVSRFHVLPYGQGPPGAGITQVATRGAQVGIGRVRRCDNGQNRAMRRKEARNDRPTDATRDHRLLA